MNKIVHSASALGVALSLFSGLAAAANICVGPVATGNGSGSDWNNVAPWSSVSLARGNTYYLMGGTYQGRSLSTAASGSLWIRIKKCATGDSVCTAIPGWQSSMGDAQGVFTGGLTLSTSYWEINGATGGGPGSWTTGHGFRWTSSAGTSIDYISISGALTNIVVSHSKFEQVGNTETSSMRANGIYSPTSLSNSTLEYNDYDNLGGLPFFLRGGSGNIIQYNYTGNICGMSVNNPNDHCEALVIHDMNDIHFRWNFISESPSSGGFVKNNTQTVDSVRIYGNVIGNGFPINCNTGPCTNWRIFNNTFFNVDSGPIGGDGGFSNLYVYNNIIYSKNVSGLPGNHNYNWYTKVSSNSCSMAAASNENVNKRYPSACDTITETSNPFQNPSATAPDGWRPAAQTPGWAGNNVCNIDACTGEKKYNLDAYGLIRGADGYADLGAFEYPSGTTASLPTPSNLRQIQ